MPSYESVNNHLFAAACHGLHSWWKLSRWRRCVIIIFRHYANQFPPFLFVDATPLYSGLYDTDNTSECDTMCHLSCILTRSAETIVVTIQYRLGALGFFKNDRLGGNYGFLDQQYALQVNPFRCLPRTTSHSN